MIRFLRRLHRNFDEYTLRTFGPYQLKYDDSLGEVLIVADRHWGVYTFYDSYFQDLPERPKALLVERVTKALEAWGYTVVVKPFTDSEE